jgi:hypothetical protein
MIMKYPAGDDDRDTRIAPKRDTRETYGEFGAIVYVYRLALESAVQTNMKGHNKGWIYHPVDTPEEAVYWLNYYKSKSTVSPYSRRPLYSGAWFVPRGHR